MTTHFHSETPDAVRTALDNARRSGQRIRIFIGDTKTGKCWNDEYDVLGRVSRSMGDGKGGHKIPILLRNSRSRGGGGILDHCIIAIATAPGHFVYKHPTLDLGTWTQGPTTSPGYVEAAYCNGELHAQFKTAGAAKRYIAFMRGERFAK